MFGIIKLLSFIKSIAILKSRTEVLDEFIKLKFSGIFVEVGVHDGRNLIKLAKKNPDWFFYGIDPYQLGKWNDLYDKGDYQNLQNRFEKLINQTKQYKNIKILREFSVNASKSFEDQSVDIIFIDAIHTYKDLKDDILAWKNKVKEGGVLSGHDFNTNYYGVIAAVNELIGLDNYEVLHDSVWFTRV